MTSWTNMLARPRFDSPLLRELKRDRILLGGAAIGTLLALLPLTQSPFLPQTDLPNQAAMATEVHRLLAGDPQAERFFMLQPHPSPYWMLYALIAGLSSFLPVLFTLKLIVGATVLCVPFGMMRLLLALRRSPRMALFAFAAGWDFSMSMGFVAFCLATGIGLFFLAKLIEFAEIPTPARGVSTGLLGLSLALCHAHGSGIIATLAGILALNELPRWRAMLRTGALGATPLVGLLPWILLGSSSEKQPIPPQIAAWPDWSERLSRLFHFSFDQVNGLGPKCALSLAFLLFLLVPLLLARPSWSGENRRAHGLYLGSWLLYLLLPATLFWPFFQLLIYERGVTLVLLMGLTLPNRVAGYRLTTVAVAAATVLLVTLPLTSQFREFGRRTAPLLDIIDAVPPSSTLLPVTYTHRTEESVRETLTQMSAYVIATKGGYSPYLFQTPNLPVRYRAEHHLPHPEWSRPNSFNLGKHARHFDYVLLQGPAGGPIARVEEKAQRNGDRETRLEKTKQSGMWTLYRVIPPAGQAKTP